MKIGIYSGLLYFTPRYQHYYDEKNLVYGNIGGADKWAIEIANEFLRQGHECVVFADCKKWHFSPEGVEYIPVDYFKDIVGLRQFDIFISSRRIQPFYEHIKAEKKILMLHEIFLLDFEDTEKYRTADFGSIAIQSESQKDAILEKYPFLRDKEIIKTNQSIDFTQYSNIEIGSKKNSMVWSSHKTRGLQFFCERIFPKIKERIKDFSLYVCSYINDNQDEYLLRDGIEVLQNVPKNQLIDLQKESKIWIYPNIAIGGRERPKETFCITAMENAAALNALIIPNNDSFSDIFEGYHGLININEIDRAITDFIRHSIKCLSDEEYRTELAIEAKNKINKYTWETAAKSFLKE